MNATAGAAAAAEARSLRAQGKLPELSVAQNLFNSKHYHRAKSLNEKRKASDDPADRAQAEAQDERNRVAIQNWRQRQKVQRTAEPDADIDRARSAVPKKSKNRSAAEVCACV